jgi:hypothetical protein
MTAPYYSSQRNLYRAKANWGADGLAPSGIAARIAQMLDRTAHLVPPGQRWFILPRKRDRYAPITQSLPDIVRENEIPGDFGEPNPGWGYSNVLLTLDSDQGRPTSASLEIFVTAGSNSLNHISFEIGGSELPPDYSRLTYPAYRDAIGVIAEVWPCPWIFANNSRSPKVHPPADVAVNGPLKPPFGGAWIAYLSSRLAEGLAPPAELVTERTEGGGLFLSTTRTLFDLSNPDEMRRSRLLEKIMLERVGVAPGGGMPQSTPVRVGPA